MDFIRESEACYATDLKVSTVFHGDAAVLLKKFPADFFRCCITSPPYWGLRDYNAAGQIGAEDDPQEYIQRLVSIFEEVRRVLTADGTLWVNIGDSYTSGNRGYRAPDKKNPVRAMSYRAKTPKGLKPKDLVGIPWRLAFALQETGWYLRSDIIWEKGNAMPECLGPSTMVFIRTHGWISRISLGQLALLPVFPEILGPQGWVQIKHVWRTKKPAMSLEASRVERVICSPEHRFPISSDRRRERVTEKDARDIRHEGYADYFLYCPIGRFLSPTIHTWMGHPLERALGYLLGVYAAEGGHDGERGFRIKLTIGAHEQAFAKTIRECLDNYSIEATEILDDSSLSFHFSAEWFTRIVDAFISGDVKTKALNIELLLNCPEEFRRALLEGYIDGDGSARTHGGWIAVSASRRLRDDLSTLASSLGIITSKGQRVELDKRTGNTYSSHALWTPYIQRRKTKSGMEGIYQVPPRHRHLLHETREMIDLEVEGGLFLIGDGLVTHNSVRDRPTKSHEYIFLLSKSPKYYYDYENVRESNGRNRRTVWSIPTEPFLGAHFATFPPKLVEPCVLAGSRPDDWVLDPFFGAGTVGVVCEQQRRKYVGIELNPKYVQLAVERIQNTERLLFSYDRERAQ